MKYKDYSVSAQIISVIKNSEGKVVFLNWLYPMHDNRNVYFRPVQTRCVSGSVGKYRLTTDSTPEVSVDNQIITDGYTYLGVGPREISGVSLILQRHFVSDPLGNVRDMSFKELQRLAENKGILCIDNNALIRDGKIKCVDTYIEEDCFSSHDFGVDSTLMLMLADISSYYVFLDYKGEKLRTWASLALTKFEVDSSHNGTLMLPDTVLSPLVVSSEEELMVRYPERVLSYGLFLTDTRFTQLTVLLPKIVYRDIALNLTNVEFVTDTHELELSCGGDAYITMNNVSGLRRMYIRVTKTNNVTNNIWLNLRMLYLEELIIECWDSNIVYLQCETVEKVILRDMQTGTDYILKSSSMYSNSESSLTVYRVGAFASNTDIEMPCRLLIGRTLDNFSDISGHSLICSEHLSRHASLEFRSRLWNR